MINFISLNLKKFFLFFLFKIKKKKICKVLNDYETFQYIKKGYSLSRFGDGELVYMFGFNHVWQIQNKILRKKLKAIFNKNYKNLLIGIPDFLYYPTIKRVNLNLDGWRLPFYCLQLLLKDNFIYGSSFVFRPFNSTIDISTNLNNQILTYLKNRKIIYIGTDKHYKNFINPIYVYDDLPEINAFDKNYFKLLEKIRQISKNKKDLSILITCGITGTLLAYDLNDYNIQAIDIGSYFKQLHFGKGYK
jgi:hypothetical protein